MGVNHGIHQARQALCLPLKVDLYLRQIERIETYFNGFSRDLGWCLIEKPTQQESGVTAHDSMQAIKEQTTQIGGGRQVAGPFDVSLPAQQGCRSQPAVLGEVIDLLDPGPQALVQLQ